MIIKEVTLDEAYTLVKKYTVPTKDAESIDIGSACGRILAEDIYAGFDDPPFDRSPMDGYAVNSSDIADASEENPVELNVVDEISAGMEALVPVGRGEAVRIMTGAPVPDGADCVVMQEKTDYGESKVKIYDAAGHHVNYCFSGENFRKGQKLLEKGSRLTFIEVGILASLGLTDVSVIRRPRVAVIATGDEIAMPGKPLPPAKIYNSNMYMIKSGAIACGAEVPYCTMSADDVESICSAIVEASGKADFVITSGGVSVGKKDLLPAALSMAGAEIVFNRVSMKPGSPTTFSVLNGVPVLSLSGSPFGAAVNFNLMARPMISVAGGDRSMDVAFSEAVFRGCFKKASKKTRFVRGICHDGQVVQADGLNSNGVIGNMGGCNCYFEIPAGTERLEDGQQVRVVDI